MLSKRKQYSGPKPPSNLVSEQDESAAKGQENRFRFGRQGAMPVAAEPVNVRFTSADKVKKDNQKIFLTVNLDKVFFKNLQYPEVVYKLIKHLSYCYEQTEAKLLTFGLGMVGNFAKIQLTEFDTITQLQGDLIFLLCTIKPKEFHGFFLNYYTKFDENGDFMIEEGEFSAILKTMAEENQMGTKKFKVFSDIMLQEDVFFNRNILITNKKRVIRDQENQSIRRQLKFYSKNSPTQVLTMLRSQIIGLMY